MNKDNEAIEDGLAIRSDWADEIVRGHSVMHAYKGVLDDFLTWYMDKKDVESKMNLELWEEIFDHFEIPTEERSYWYAAKNLAGVWVFKLRSMDNPLRNDDG